jgi:hypothetical protein
MWVVTNLLATRSVIRLVGFEEACFIFDTTIRNPFLEETRKQLLRVPTDVKEYFAEKIEAVNALQNALQLTASFKPVFSE